MARWIGAALAFTLVAACGPARAETAAITVGVTARAAFGPLVLAARTGLFERHGLAVTLKTMTNDDLSKGLATDALQCAGAPIESLIVWNARNIRMRAVAQIDRSSAAGVLARGDIATLAGLKGRTVGVGAPGTRAFFLFAWMLEGAGVSRRSVKPLTLAPGPAVQAFLAGQVDAAVSDDLPSAPAQPNAGHVLALDGDDPAASDLLGCTTAFLDRQPAAAGALLDGYFDALAAMDADPEKTDAAVGAGLGQTSEAFAAAAKKLRWSSRAENKTFFATTFDGFAATAAQLLLEIGTIDTKPDPKTLVDGRPLGPL